MKRFQQLLAITLSMSFTGIGPALTAALADEGPSLRAISQRGNTLDEELRLLIRRARHPGTPGTPAGIPNAADLTAVEARFKNWKHELEAALAVANAPAPGVTTYLPIDAKLGAINEFMNRLSTLVTLRILQRLPHGENWREEFSLNIPKAVMADFPGLGASAQNRLGDRFFPLVVDRGASGQADPVKLRVSETLVQGLEVGRLADQPDDASFLTMVQYMASRQILQSIADLRYLKADRTSPEARIAPSLVRKMESFGAAQLIQDEQRRAVSEPGARRALSESFRAVAPQLPSLVTRELVEAISREIGTDANMIRDLVGPLTGVLAEAERDNLAAAVEQEIEAASLTLGALPERELIPTLRFMIANAKANTQLNKLLQLMADGVLALPAEKRGKVLELIEARKKVTSDSIPQNVLTGWADAAHQLTDTHLFDQRRSDFIEHLLLTSATVGRRMKRASDGDSFELGQVMRIHSEDFARLNPRENVRSWLFDILGQQTYTAARDSYAKIMTSVSNSAVLSNGFVDRKKVEAYVSKHDFRRDAAAGVEFDPRVQGALREALLKRLVDGRGKDIRDLLALGDWLGFHRIWPKGAPKISELLPTKEQQELYYDGVSSDLLSSFPILSSEVTSIDGNSSVRLADALAEINGDLVSSQANIDRASLLVDQALIQVEHRLLEQLQKVGEATNLESIEKVVTSTLMLELVMQTFPEFRVSQERFIEELMNPSLVSQLMHRYVGWYLGAGFGGILLLQGAKKFVKRSSPYINAIMQGLSPFLKGYMSSAMVLIVADTAYQANELRQLRARAKDTEDLFMSGVSGSSFYSQGDLAAAQGGYSMAKWMFVGRMVMDTALMYLPMAKGVVSSFGEKILLREFMGDVKAFADLGLNPGEWGTLDGTIHRMRAEAVHSGAVGGEAIGQAERAYVRLAEKVRTGKTWEPHALFPENPLDMRVEIPRLLRKPRIITYEEFRADVDAFQRLGITDGEWHEVREALQNLRTEINGNMPNMPAAWQVEATQTLEEAEKAAARLLKRVADKSTYELQAARIRSGKPLSKHEKKIEDLMRKQMDSAGGHAGGIKVPASGGQE